ncbi:MAG: type II toxin-antitoxin system Phd/YefM family antitoxin [Dehalococcoidales bacterium]|nr:type II toxin-antitoxin system Phd/YefM family antitoxin [Dehalococcoidales bacterium]
MARKVSAAEAKAKLSALMAEVAFGGQHIVIERRGKPFAAMVTIGELECLEQGRATSTHPRGALALVGAWKDVPDNEIDILVADIYKAREEDTGRPVLLEV